MTFDEWFTAEYKGTDYEDGLKVLLHEAWEASREVVKDKTMHTCPGCGYPHDRNWDSE